MSCTTADAKFLLLLIKPLKIRCSSKNVPEKKESGEAFESKKSFDDYVKEVKHLKDTESKPKEICLSYDDFMKDFRSIVGYFDKKVVKNYDVNQE